MKTETINSPLEGTICNIKVGEHDHVRAGQALLGIRDKQMLHLITAQAEADVDRLLVQAGQFVEPGDALIEIHAESTDSQRDAVEGDPEDMSTWQLI